MCTTIPVKYTKYSPTTINKISKVEKRKKQSNMMTDKYKQINITNKVLKYSILKAQKRTCRKLGHM